MASVMVAVAVAVAVAVVVVVAVRCVPGLLWLGHDPFLGLHWTPEHDVRHADLLSGLQYELPQLNRLPPMRIAFINILSHQALISSLLASSHSITQRPSDACAHTTFSQSHETQVCTSVTTFAFLC